MIDFIVGLLFGKLILLNPTPFNVTAEYTLDLQTPVSAVTSGAHLILQVPLSVLSSGPDPVRITKGAGEIFQKGWITAYVSQSQGPISVTMRYEAGPGESGYTATHYLVRLKPTSPVPTKTQFDRVRLITKEPLQKVTLQWSSAEQIGG